MRRFLVLLTTAGLLAVPATNPASAVASTASPPIGPATLSSWSGARQVFTALEAATNTAPSTGGVSGIATDLIGWALGAVGMAVDDDDAEEVAQNLENIGSSLDEVQDSLSAISQQLDQLQVQLAALSLEQAWVNCSEQTQANSGPVAVIQSAADEYDQFIDQANNAVASEPAPELDGLIAWAQEYTDANDLATALDAIDDVLSGTAQTGSLQACGQALAKMYAGSELGFEAKYYQALYAYLSYWYQTQVQALNLYVEAQHLLALHAAGDLSGFQPTNPGAICTQDINGAVTTACDLAAQQVNDVYDNIVGQLMTAGAPYLWGSGGMISATPPGVSNKLWVLDLNDFQADGCALPLTSNTAACGATVGTTGGLSQPTWGPFTWGSYSAWQPAVTSDWQDLLPVAQQIASNGSPILAALIDSGLGDTSWGAGRGLQNLLIYTGEVTSSTNAGLNARTWYDKAPSDVQNTVVGMCLLDTAGSMAGGFDSMTWVRPLCDGAGGGTLSALLSKYDIQTSVWSAVAPDGGEGQWWGGGPWTNTAFYAANFSEGPKDSPWWVNQMPGWMTQTYGLVAGTTPQVVSQQPQPQYRWPVLPIKNLTCTVNWPNGTAMTTTTSAGAYTMCGPDMAAWMSAQLPPQPVPVASTSLSVSPRLGSAAVSWKALKRQRHVVGYRIRGQFADRPWRTMVKNTSVKRSASAQRRTMTYPVRVKRSGMWRFKVVTLLRERHSRPSKPTRREFIATTKVPARFYTFRKGSQTRVVKATRDARVYWVSPKRSGFGTRRAQRVTGQWSRNRFHWSGRWNVQVSGGWKNLRWDKWSRVAGPALTRRGMPLQHKQLPRW